MEKRCDWLNQDPLYISYHDEEWGVPVYDDKKLFELLCLEGAQAGLSWYTILKKREAYREAFDGFDAEKIVHYDEKKIDELMQNRGIVRNRLKIKSIIRNANAFLLIQKESSFGEWIWNFVDHKPIINHRKSIQDVPAQTELSELMSKGLIKRGFSFVGPTICYAFMQAAGLVDDHIEACFKRK